MVTRARDLDAFAYGNPHDVALADDGDGLVFVCVGSLPERRHLVRAAYGMLMLRNGVPTGYVQADVALGHAEVSFNVFDTFRGAEAGRLFARVLAFVHHAFDVTTFSIEPYQLGLANAEAIDSGAWWFYYKFGFRPTEPEILELAGAELERMRGDAGHRSTKATLRTLASRHVHFALDQGHTVGPPPYPGIARAVSKMIATRFGGDRPRAMRRSPALALGRLGLRSFGATTADERRAVARLSPLILCLPDVESWSREERRAVAPLVRAKGGTRERDFLERLARHPRFGESLLRIED
jgi:hypothetical protein